MAFLNRKRSIVIYDLRKLNHIPGKNFINGKLSLSIDAIAYLSLCLDIEESRIVRKVVRHRIVDLIKELINCTIDLKDIDKNV